MFSGELLHLVGKTATLVHKMKLKTKQMKLCKPITKSACLCMYMHHNSHENKLQKDAS